MEKECALCGGFFETNNARRLYCDECLAHKKKRQKEIYGARERLNRSVMSDVVERDCEECGKHFKTYRKTLFTMPNDNSKSFCSRKCLLAYRRKDAVCEECGKSLKDKADWDPAVLRTYFCSQECLDKYEYEKAKKNGTLHVCERCGKEFIRSGKATFCSEACYRAAIKDGWKKDVERTPSRVSKKEVCRVCGKVLLIEYPSKKDIPVVFLCSAECRSKFEAYKRTAKREAVKRDTEKSLDPDDITTPLCADCKVSYKDCVRMQTGFRVLPEGAHYNKKGVLVTCPDYKK